MIIEERDVKHLSRMGVRPLFMFQECAYSVPARFPLLGAAPWRFHGTAWWTLPRGASKILIRVASAQPARENSDLANLVAGRVKV